MKYTRDARSVFVEGSTDERILNQAFRDCGRPDIVAYDVGLIDFDGIPDLSGSKREKCFFIAKMLETDCVQFASGKAICIVDADFDLYNGTLSAGRFLAYTEHADLILYFARASVLRYFGVHVFGDEASLANVLDQVFAVCQKLFGARLALQKIDRSIRFIDDASRACDVVDDKIALDIQRLAAQILGPARAMQRMFEFIERADAFVPRGDLGPTAQMNGHDFVRVFRYALMEFGRARFSRQIPDATIEAIVFGGQAAANLCATSLLMVVFASLCELH